MNEPDDAVVWMMAVRGPSGEECRDLTVASILYVGHATTLIELDGVQLVTDPLLPAATSAI